MRGISDRAVCPAAAALVAALAVAVPAGAARSAVPARPDNRTIVHVLNRLGFGPAPGDMARVRQIGLARYIDEQLQPERLADVGMAPRLTGLSTLTKSTRELADQYFLPAAMERRRAQQQAANDRAMAGVTSDGTERPAARTPEQTAAVQAERDVFAELAQQKVLRAVYSERQLDEVMVDFWFNHFNVFAGKGETRLYLTEYERDTIRPHVFGKFRDLLGAVAESPAMLFYLDNWQSAAPDGSVIAAPAGRTPARNMGRPGVLGRRRAVPVVTSRSRPAGALPQAMSNRRSRGLNENYARELMELHTLGVDGGYTQKDVQEVARAFTGWTIATPGQGGPFRFEPRMHDDGEKIVLGHRIKAGGGRKDAEQVLDILAEHPATARFIAAKLARRFVADQPPASVVDRAAARFRQTHGDIREVVRTIVTSPEFFAPASYRAKVKSPLELVASAMRATSAEAVNAQPLVQALRDLGMPSYQCQPPTGYPDRAEAWVNTGALLNRMNFAVALAGGRLRGIRILSAEPGGAGVVSASDVFVDQILAGDLSEATRSIVGRATQPSQALALLLGSPEFQRR